MISEDKDDDGDALTSHIFMALNPNGPVPDTAERLIQQTELALRQLFDMTQLLYDMLRTGAPIVMMEPSVKATLAAIGASVLSMGKSSEKFMEAKGIAALDLQAEQLRIVRELLDQHPDLPAELRDSLLAMLAKGLDAAKPAAKSTEDAEWPSVLTVPWMKGEEH